MRVNLENDLDSLFQLPLAEFTAARNALAARLKKAGQTEDADQVKSMGKPSVSAWAVNQLYWKHRDEFQDLMAAGEQLRRSHKAQLAGKASDIRGSSDSRRKTLASLSGLGEKLLRQAGHSPTPETMRRISATLEALSSFPASTSAPTPGRLTSDVEPPGFESLAALMPTITTGKANTALIAAEATLRQSRAKLQDLTEALEDAGAHAEAMERARLEAGERFKKAAGAAEEARARVRNLTADIKKAEKAVADAQRDVDKAR